MIFALPCDSGRLPEGYDPSSGMVRSKPERPPKEASPNLSPETPMHPNNQEPEREVVSLTDSLSARLEELLAKASKLPWEVETEHDPDAEYGSGPDPDRGFDDFIVFDAMGQLLFGTATSDAKCIVEEPYGDEDGYRQAWDETGKANVDLIVEAINALPTLLSERSTLIAGMEEARRLLAGLESAAADYRMKHDLKGDGSPEAGRAWDLMRRAEFAARAYLSKEPNNGR